MLEVRLSQTVKLILECHDRNLLPNQITIARSGSSILKAMELRPQLH